MIDAPATLREVDSQPAADTASLLADLREIERTIEDATEDRRLVTERLLAESRQREMELREQVRYLEGRLMRCEERQS